MKTAAEKGKTVEQPSTDKHKDIQPSVFPAVGAPPHTHAGAGPWLMAPNPAQSLGWPAGGQMYGGQQFQPGMAAAMPPWAGVHGPLLADGSPAAQFYAPPSHLVNNIAYSAFTPPFFQVRFSYLFPFFIFCFLDTFSCVLSSSFLFSTLHLSPWTMNYRNCAPPSGVNFQPPVPDTTFGTISHVHVPRFDAGAAPVGLPISPMMIQSPQQQQMMQMQMQMTPALPVQAQPLQIPYMPAPTCTTVLVPSTFYVNEYPYYASGFRQWLFFVLLAGP